MARTTITEPTAEPLTTDEAKQHLNILNEDHDAYIDALIAAARVQCEVLTRQVAMTTTLEDSFDCFPTNGVIPLASPLQSVTSVKYYDEAGDEQTLATDQYVVRTDSNPGAVLRGYEKIWPTIRSIGIAQPVVVRYVAGHASAAAVPASFKHAMKLLIGHWFRSRESVAIGTIATELPSSVKSLVACAWRGDYP